MPYELANIQANPVFMEQYPRVGEYIQGGHGTEVDFYNPSSNKTILPGEPVEVFGRLGISKDLILPGTYGSLVFGAWVEFMLDPAMVANILQGALVYFDLDLAVAGSYIPGYATGVQPSNGWTLGYAVGRHGTGSEISLSAYSPIAAAAGDARVFVLMHAYSGDETVTKFGTVTDFLSTA